MKFSVKPQILKYNFFSQKKKKQFLPYRNSKKKIKKKNYHIYIHTHKYIQFQLLIATISN